MMATIIVCVLNLNNWVEGADLELVEALCGS